VAYKARREPDGFYTITGVPVFAEVPKGTKGAPFDIDREWLDAALAKSRTREKEGYLAPLHFEHHGGGEKSFKAGHYRLTRVGKVKVGGDKKFAIFADFLKIPAHVFASLMQNDWPYRSVEIVSYEEHEIESVALLDDETPFHKFELLNADTIDLESTPEDPASHLPVLAGPVAFARTERGYAGLYRFSEARMKINLKGNPKDGYSAFDEDGMLATGDIAGAEFHLSGAEFESDDLPDDEKELSRMAKAIAAKLKKMAKGKPKKLMDDDEDDKKRDEDDGHKPAEAKHAAADLAGILCRFDAMEAELASLKSAKVRDELLASTLAALKTDGYHVSKLTSSTMEKYAGDKAGLINFVAHYRATVPKDGPPTLGDSDKGNEEDPVVADFARQGEDAHRAAITAASEFGNLVKAGMRSGTDEERVRFMRSYMGTRGFKVAV